MLCIYIYTKNYWFQWVLPKEIPDRHRPLGPTQLLPGLAGWWKLRVNLCRAAGALGGCERKKSMEG